MAGNNATPAVFPFFAVAIDDVEFLTFAPKSEKILGIALAIGVDLEDERNVPAACFPVADEAALSVAPIRLVKNFEARSELIPEARQNLRGAVGRAIIDGQEDEVFSPIFYFVKPLEDDFADGRLLVVDGHDDHEFGSHERGGRTVVPW